MSSTCYGALEIVGLLLLLLFIITLSITGNEFVVECSVLAAALQAGDTTITDLEEKLAMAINQKAELDEEVKDLEGRLEDMESSNEGMTEKLHKKDEQIEALKKSVENLESTVQKVTGILFLLSSPSLTHFSIFPLPLSASLMGRSHIRCAARCCAALVKIKIQVTFLPVQRSNR